MNSEVFAELCVNANQNAKWRVFSFYFDFSVNHYIKPDPTNLFHKYIQNDLETRLYIAYKQKYWWVTHLLRTCLIAIWTGIVIMASPVIVSIFIILRAFIDIFTTPVILSVQ